MAAQVFEATQRIAATCHAGAVASFTHELLGVEASKKCAEGEACEEYFSFRTACQPIKDQRSSPQ